MDSAQARSAPQAPPAVAAAGPVTVASLEAQDEARWNAFVELHPGGTFFHLAQWREVLRRAFGHRPHYLVAQRGGRISGVLPLAQVRSLLFGHALVSTPFCVYGGILAEDDASLQALTRAACDLGENLGVDYVEMRNRRPLHEGWPAKDLYVTFRRPIDADPEKNMQAIPRKQRAMVRKGLQKQLQAHIDTDTRRMYDIYSESLRNLGTPVFARSYPRVLQQVFGSQCEVLTVQDGARPVASVLSFYFRDEVLPYYGGSTYAARAAAGNDFMYWQVMERARERGARLFDFGRSKRDTGSFDFKKNWGFEPEPLHYQYHLVRARAMPNLSPSNARYSRMIGAWRRLPLGLTRVVGPPLARYLG
ncbi:MAG: FemAB family PEP-CTERM system-associated protein [Proteobacteria bacterium]|nr:FemAB family PEP-CTERM system-associated protein [Pseudomonadota bacterium]